MGGLEIIRLGLRFGLVGFKTCGQVGDLVV